VFSALTVSGSAWAAEDPVATRQNLMKSNGAAVRMLTQMVRGEQPYDAAKAEIAMRSIHAVAAGFRFHFPEGSTGGNTAAAPRIWEDKAGWQAANEKFEADSFAAIGPSGQGADQLRTAFQTVAGNCQSCHQNYRINR